MLRQLRFDLWYLFRPPWDRGTSPPELLNYVATHRPGRAIDLGCGSGTNVLTLALRGWKVTGVDFAPRAIRRAKTKMGRAGATADFLIEDVSQSTDLHGPFDLALDIGCFHGLRERTVYLANLAGALEKGAHWLLYGFMGSVGSRAGVGLNSWDFDLVKSHNFRMLERWDGVNRRGRPSAWFLFEKAGNTL
ncbi:MAG: class I SAM-dependent methyltransferase [Chloroflexota bacterium]